MGPFNVLYCKWLVAMWFPSHLCDEGNSSFTSKLLKIQELWQNFLKILIPLSSFLPTILSTSVVVSIFQPKNKGDSSNPFFWIILLSCSELVFLLPILLFSSISKPVNGALRSSKPDYGAYKRKPQKEGRPKRVCNGPIYYIYFWEMSWIRKLDLQT